MQTQSSPSYTVSAQLLAREDFQTACRDREFGEVFKLMRKYDGVSQDRIASPVEGLQQGRVSRIMNGKERVQTADVIERIADSLHIPGSYLGLAPREWEEDTAPADDLQVIHAPDQPAPWPPAGELIDRRLTLDIDVTADGEATLTYHQELFNGTSLPLTGLTRELWFEHTTGPLTIEPIPPAEDDPDPRNLIVKKIHQSPTNATYACRLFPALPPGESTTIAYTCRGGRFVDAFYWRQALVYPTQELRIRLTHHGIRQLTDCTGIEEGTDGTELSIPGSITWTRSDDAVNVELVRRNLAVNQFVTLRWDFARATA